MFVLQVSKLFGNSEDIWVWLAYFLLLVFNCEVTIAGELSDSSGVVVHRVALPCHSSWFEPELGLLSLWSFCAYRFPPASLVSSYLWMRLWMCGLTQCVLVIGSWSTAALFRMNVTEKWVCYMTALYWALFCTVSEKPVCLLCMLINLSNKKTILQWTSLHLGWFGSVCYSHSVEVCYRIGVPASKDGIACIFMLPAMHTHCPGWPNAVDVALLLAAVMHLQLNKTAFCITGPDRYNLVHQTAEMNMLLILVGFFFFWWIAECWLRWQFAMSWYWYLYHLMISFNPNSNSV